MYLCNVSKSIQILRKYYVTSLFSSNISVKKKAISNRKYELFITVRPIKNNISHFDIPLKYFTKFFLFLFKIVRIEIIPNGNLNAWETSSMRWWWCISCAQWVQRSLLSLITFVRIQGPQVFILVHCTFMFIWLYIKST